MLEALEGAEGPIIAASDYMKVVADQLAPWLRAGWCRWGRIAAAALSKLARDGQFEVAKARAAFAELGVDTEKIDPMLA